MPFDDFSSSETEPTTLDSTFDAGGGETPGEAPDTPETTAQPDDATQPPPQAGQVAEPAPLTDAMLDALIDIERAGGRVGKMKVRDAPKEIRSLRQALNAEYTQRLELQRRLQEAEAARARPQQGYAPPRIPQPQAQYPQDEAAYLETDPATAAHIAALKQEISEVKSWKSQIELQQQDAVRQQATMQAFREFDGMARQAIETDPAFKTYDERFIYRSIADYTLMVTQNDRARYENDPVGAMEEAINWLSTDLRERDAKVLRQMQSGAQIGREARVQGAGGEAPLPQRSVPKDAQAFEKFLEGEAEDLVGHLERSAGIRR